MSARNFIRLMFLLIVMTSVLLALSSSGKPVAPTECPAGDAGSMGIQAQAADGTMILETLSRHLLSAVQ